ncbi:GDSL-type esterase/lipase family protein [Microbacterium saperdae]
MPGTLVMRLLQPALAPAKKHRRSQFEAVPQPDVDAVFVGDSITEGGLWNEWFPTITTANRGIGGETSGEVVERLDTLVANTRIVFLLIGTNDLALGVREDTIVTNVRRILDHLRSVVPEARIILQSVMPRQAKWRTLVTALNVRLRDEAAQAGAQYLDLWPLLSGPDGAIDPAYSFDGLHLNGEGYRVWVDAISPLIRKSVDGRVHQA